ncbi:MAG: cation diffusion facilitator CzcD-associated flavoprotein CzcO/acetyl esterase/lipase [Candidatus Poriferisodalaceae bacterium]|jgi:cation diffusion facilitator CzcD-associated flavoprotein CzcO/acetyl esterase/lipase
MAEDYDVVVVGAGMAGLYSLHKLRELGFSAVALETGDDVGGTWYWNRYPGARCDIPTTDYTYSFDPDLEDEWEWSEKYAAQPEILRYLQHVADKHDLRRDIRFSTRVENAAWDDDTSRWVVRTQDGDVVTGRHYVMATGCLSAPKSPDVDGLERFGGDVYFTSSWPHEGVDFSGKRVGVIGTGSSGIQSIPIIAEQADALTVFQRTANFSVPAGNGPIPAEMTAAVAADRAKYREAAKRSQIGVPLPVPTEGATQVSEDERNRRFQEGWDGGTLFGPFTAFNDIIVNPVSNDYASEFVREKIRAKVNDPEVAETLCPYDFPLATKRMCLDTGYYETFNQPHVTLVDLRKDPIATITETGIDTATSSHTFDAIVFATGFDAMTGAIVNVDITGREGQKLKDNWQDGPETYLGVTTVGFPNLYMVTGPQSPSVLSNMSVSIEQHVEWICDTINHLRESGYNTIEPTATAQAGWVQHNTDWGNITLFPQAKSWYMGSNVPGKPRIFLPYVGGVDTYRQVCDEVVDRDYLGFALTSPDKSQCNDGVIRRVQPDVQLVLDAMAEMDLQPIESMSPAEAREFMTEANNERPPGPEVGEIVDGTLPGAAGDLAYRLYRPSTPGPHPVVAYFHGGGWVLGDTESDDPFCRDLCVQSDALIVSVDYRHAPEHRFPAAPDDGFAAVRWLADNAESLGGIGGQLSVAGWSAGGNIAAVVCQMARDAGGPTIIGQLLVTPVTDSDLTRPSYSDNADGYILTTPLMEWFWDHYADAADRSDPRASPLRASDLSGLPPAVIVTSEFDPLRDEGAAYADALAAAGVDVTHLPQRGQIHTSLAAVDMVISGAQARVDMGAALRRFSGSVTSG